MMSSTTSNTGNHPSIRHCKRCGNHIFYCTCWWDLMDKLDRIIEIKMKTEVYKFVLNLHSIWISIVSLIRITPTCISGMKGLKLLQRMDKI